MTRYRYVTPALHGRWRNTREEALADAVRAGQARANPALPGEFVMLGGVRIEERSAEAGGENDLQSSPIVRQLGNRGKQRDQP